MTDLLEQAVKTARTLSSELQDEIARIVLMVAKEPEDEFFALTADERSAIAHSKSAAARGEFASDEEIRAIWEKHGL